MGTRHLTAVICDGEFRIAQYGQWDGYPDGAGVDICKFIVENHTALPAFRDAVRRKCRFIDDAEVERIALQFGRSIDGGGSIVMTLDESERYEAEYPSLHRNTGSNILAIVLRSNQPEVPLRDGRDFATDSLFCEWAYVLDLDRSVLEIYCGFNTTKVPPGQRWSTVDENSKPKGWAPKYKGDKYHYPVRLAAVFHFDTIPTPETFVKVCERGAENVTASRAATDQLRKFMHDTGTPIGIATTDAGVASVWSLATCNVKKS